ncbi:MULTISPECIES: tetratricopeptide repeat protein [unclassified Polaribacter]|uniref:tetratricopeptide repeat protein n=1 Tax=unclassified Polaribacter TaxID=196858 RepID=UPI0011BF045C|nr:MULTISPECIES: hypothetical protein [unclassified Polaribacter]TXD50903.1 hypothetical protein ES043_14345 [Polaribacter sp. IC063]TXD57576.1 hypothetical protein ES044_14725 [Polaribacter sp. IC066]
MKKLILLLLLTTQILSSQENEFFEQAVILIEKEQYKEAIKILDKVLDVNPNFVGAYVQRGTSKSALHKNREAIEDYRKAINLDSLNTLSFFNIANNYRDLNDDKKAIYYYNKAEQSIQNNTYHQHKNIPLKRTFLTEMAPFYVSKSQIHYNRGLTFYDLKEYSFAFKDFSTIENNEITKESEFMLASSLLKLNRNKKACIRLNNAISLGSKMALEIKKRYCK